MRKLVFRSVMPLVFSMALGLCAAADMAPAAETSHSKPAAEASDTGSDHEAGDTESHRQSAPLDFKGDLALWSLVVFILFVLVLKKFAWGPLTEGLDKRESRIRQDIVDAEAARLKAEQMLADHAAKLDEVRDEVKGILAEARRDAEGTKQEIVTAAQREAEATQQRAVGEIERAKDQALQELFDAMADRVADATEHVLGRTLNEADQDRFIDEALSQFSESAG